MTDLTALVSERQQIRTFLEQQQAAFAEFCKPHNEKMQQLDAQITATMTEQGIKSFKTDTGTAILSTIVTPKVTDKEKFLDWVLEDWDSRGAMLQIATPLKETITDYMDQHEGQLPPNIETTSRQQFSIRKA